MIESAFETCPPECFVLLRDVLAHAVKLYPNRPALADGDRSFTYREASERVHRLAAGLLKLGLKPGDNIAILAHNSHRYWETYFVADIAGMPLAPLNTRLAAHELEFILNDGDVKALILGLEFLPAYSQFRPGTPGIEHVILLAGESGECLDYEQLIEENAPLDHSVREWDEDDMLNLCYTGGTTGLPKGVMLTQRNIVSNAQHAMLIFNFTEHDTWLHVAPMFHLADAWACYAITLAGGLHAFIPGFAPQATLEAIQRWHVTKTILVPTMINMLVNFPGIADYDTSSIEKIAYGASPMPVERLLAAVKTFGPRFVQAYGMTETAPLATAMLAHWLTFDGSAEDTRRVASCGRQVPGVEVRVVDQVTGEDVKPGQPGEIIIRGPNVMKGYWKREKETAEALRGGYMHTGDVAVIDQDNFVYIVDRAKDMIISGGENIYTTEVENALYEHPAVLEAAVIGIPDEQWGEAVLAVVVLREGAKATEQEMVDHCRTLIAGYKCPKRVIFQESPLPKTGAGKIQKTELRKPFWAGESRNVH
ncbi:MAG: long-chain-fatty-acid--CoA ligase [Chloroflexi bacterium]|nr:long-chain-fatty-acid--CoA ligase [Chloroflexota bacterium]